MAPEVSVIIPTYNRAESLPRAIRSVLNQTFSDFEIIIVDDGSIDDSRNLLSELVDSDPRIIYIRRNVNRGGAAARNLGIQQARGTYIAFLDSDDEWLETKLEKQVGFLKAREPESLVLYSRYFVREGTLLRRDRDRSRRGRLYREFLSGFALSMTSCTVLRADLLRRVGGFDESLQSLQDQDLWIRLAEHYPFDYLEEALAVVHNDSPTRVSRDVRLRAEGIEQFMRKWEPVISSEVGGRTAESWRADLRAAMYAQALMESLFQRDLPGALECLRSLGEANRLSAGILARIPLALLGRRTFGVCKSLVYRARQAYRQIRE